MKTSTLNKLAGLIHGMELKDRIKLAMDGAGLSPADLARATKSTNAAVTFWLNGETKSLKATKAAMIEIATGFNAQWIVSGKGPQKHNQTLVTNQPLALIQQGRVAIGFDDAVRVIAEHLGNVDAPTSEMVMGVLARLAQHPEEQERIGRAAMAVLQSGKQRAA